MLCVDDISPSLMPCSMSSHVTHAQFCSQNKKYNNNLAAAVQPISGALASAELRRRSPRINLVAVIRRDGVTRGGVETVRGASRNDGWSVVRLPSELFRWMYREVSLILLPMRGFCIALRPECKGRYIKIRGVQGTVYIRQSRCKH